MVDLTSIGYFLPLISFLLIFVIVFSVLRKTEVLGKELFIQIFVSFLLATVFVSAISIRQYVLTIIPWFAVLIISLFFLLALIGLVGKSTEFMHKGIGIAVVLVFLAVFLISGIKVFNYALGPYLPGSTVPGGDPDILKFTDWLYSPKVSGAVLLLIVSALVSWVLVRAGAKKKD